MELSVNGSPGLRALEVSIEVLVRTHRFEIGQADFASGSAHSFLIASVGIHKVKGKSGNRSNS